MSIIESNKVLCERFPFLIPRNCWTGEIPKDYDYSCTMADFELPNGWRKLFFQMCEDIYEVLKDSEDIYKLSFMQVKEKYGSLRVYLAPFEGSAEIAPFKGSAEKLDTIYEIINKYEYVSQYICTKCGTPTNLHTIGWIEPICKDCIMYNGFKYEVISEYIPKKFSIICYSNKERVEKELDCTDIWERYLREE